MAIVVYKLSNNFMEPHFGIALVSRRTGLTQHVIRIWEKRYGAVRPGRSPTSRRCYSPGDLERLNLLSLLTRSGHGIGSIAGLPTATLRKLVGGAPGKAPRAPASPVEPRLVDGFIDECVAAIRSFDGRRLQEALRRLESRLGAHGSLQRGIAPLVRLVGELWRKGDVTVAQEHFASVEIRGFLSSATRAFAQGDGAPLLLVATPAGQLHELGALLAGAAAGNMGWRVVHLGVGLPAAEVAGAAIQTRARAVALSLVHPEDDPALGPELLKLRDLLPPEIPIFVGGRAVASYREAVRRINAVHIDDLGRFCTALDGLRTLPQGPGS